MKSRTAFLLWLDCSMLLLVIVLESLSLTGIRLHEWLGYVLCLLILLHVVMQWSWFMTQFQRILIRAAMRVRINAGLNLLLLFLMAAVLVSGVLVSNLSLDTIGPRLGSQRVWSEVHGWLNFVLVVVVGLHLALNWDWMTAAFRRLRPKRPGSAETVPRKGIAPAAMLSFKVTQWLGRTFVVLVVSFVAAGGAYFALVSMTAQPNPRVEQSMHGTTKISRPRGRPRSVSGGLRELSVTTATVAICIITGRFVLRLRL
jgi:hypothetical protein